MSGFSIRGAAFPARVLEPGLYIVATPIGNLGDITIRALDTLASATLVACEDTRVSGKLLKHFGISTRMLSYHEHNAGPAGEKILAAIRQGGSVALITDAGTPIISDPGQRLVALVRGHGLPVWPVPGASAPVAALSASGMANDAFLFAGFLPTKEMARRARLREFKALKATLVFFESPNRLDKALADIAAELGETREVAICREITKLHEEQVWGTAGELAHAYAGKTVKGEIVLLIAPPQEEALIDPDALIGELLERMSVSEAAAEAARMTGLPRRMLYSRALELAKPQTGDAQ
jgi:16S rRNA (cytidine1402-2'-O)-methyltransferase